MGFASVANWPMGSNLWPVNFFIFEGDERYADIKILDVVSFLAQQINEKKENIGQTSVPVIETVA